MHVCVHTLYDMQIGIECICRTCIAHIYVFVYFIEFQLLDGTAVLSPTYSLPVDPTRIVEPIEIVVSRACEKNDGFPIQS